MNRIPAQNPCQPAADLPAGRQNHLIVIATTGLGAHRPHQILTTDKKPLALQPIVRKYRTARSYS